MGDTPKPEAAKNGEGEAPRPVPPPPLPKPPEQAAKPPELPADALAEVSRRLSAVEKKPITQLGAGAVFALAFLAAVLVGACIALVAAIRRTRPKEK